MAFDCFIYLLKATFWVLSFLLSCYVVTWISKFERDFICFKAANYEALRLSFSKASFFI